MIKKIFHLSGSAWLVLAFLLIIVHTATNAPPELQDEEDFSLSLWQNGEVWYKFDEGYQEIDLVLEQMSRWENALSLPDPLHPDQVRQYIDFKECDADHPCQPCAAEQNCRPYVLIRFQVGDEKAPMCWPMGMDTDDFETELIFPNPFTNKNTILHELGHCLGLYHDFNRLDRERWLLEEVGVLNDHPIRNDRMPVLGNYDYDSVMHYASGYVVENGVVKYGWRDWLGNTFSRWVSDRVSDRDISRLLQYYAWEHQSNWGFFHSLSTGVNASNPDALPNPYLAGGVEAIGTPAISYQGPGNYDVFVLGSDNELYWKAFRADVAEDWVSLGCCFASEPSAVSRAAGHIDVVIIEKTAGKLVYNHYDGAWDGWQIVRGGFPPGGIKTGAQLMYIGPAITSRGIDSLDVFIARSNGLLAVTTYSEDAWGPWRTNLGVGYVVTARPAAIAISDSEVRLAINVADTRLFEPQVTFPPLAENFLLGAQTAYTAPRTPPALTRRADPLAPYRVLISNPQGRISHRFASGFGRWRDIGGIPKTGTGVSAVTMGPYSAMIVMNGEDAVSCVTSCIPEDPEDPLVQPGPGAGYIQPGGLWLRLFNGRKTEIYHTFLPVIRR